MEIFLMVLGIAITIFAMLTIYYGNKKIDARAKVLESYETTLLEMKKMIEDLDGKVKQSSGEKIKEMKELIKEADRKNLILDNKIKEGYGLNGILERNFERIGQVEVEIPISFNKVDSKKSIEISIEEIIKLYKEGKSLKEISEITGKTLEEIAAMIGM
jgi:hypothetical protein